MLMPRKLADIEWRAECDICEKFLTTNATKVFEADEKRSANEQH